MKLRRCLSGECSLSGIKNYRVLVSLYNNVIQPKIKCIFLLCAETNVPAIYQLTNTGCSKFVDQLTFFLYYVFYERNDPN